MDTGLPVFLLRLATAFVLFPFIERACLGGVMSQPLVIERFRLVYQRTVYHLIGISIVLLVSAEVSWSFLSPTSLSFSLAISLAALLCWRSITLDFDLSLGRQQIGERIVALLLFFLVIVSPAFLPILLFVLIQYLGGWQHHTHIPMRILYMIIALSLGEAVLQQLFWLNGTVLSSSPEAVSLYAVLIVLASHYYGPALAKMKLGERWSSWVLENPTWQLAASAYMYGWLAYIPERTMLRVLSLYRRSNVLMNAFTLLVESAALLLLFDRSLAIALIAGFILLHIGIFAAAGICFWEAMAVNLLLIGVVSGMSPEMVAVIFQPTLAVLAMVLIHIVAIRHFPWRPSPLAWWDTPTIAKLEWEAVGESGAVFSVNNDFMSPHERLFGRNHGRFLVEKRFLGGHMDTVPNAEVRDAIIASANDKAALDAIKEEHGKLYFDLVKREEHLLFLKRFFLGSNAGMPKSILPHALRFLRAPGGQWFYWGRHPRFNGQEAVRQVRVRYREMSFVGKPQVLVDEIVAEVEIGSEIKASPRLIPRPSKRYLNDLFREDLACTEGRSVAIDISSAHFKNYRFFRSDIYLGFDLNFESLQKRPVAGETKIWPVQGQIEQLPLRPRSIDVVVSTHTLGFVAPEKRAEVICKLGHLVKPGGCIIFNVVDPGGLIQQRLEGEWREAFVFKRNQRYRNFLSIFFEWATRKTLLSQYEWSEHGGFEKTSKVLSALERITSPMGIGRMLYVVAERVE